MEFENGSFSCSSLYTLFPRKCKYEEGHIVFAFSALNCLKMLSAIDRVDSEVILKNIGRYQKDDGSFSSFPNGTECDLRFVYSALAICKLFNNFSYVNMVKCKQYIENCYNFDGGFGLRPKD